MSEKNGKSTQMTTTVINVKAMGLQEKTRIEKLIDTRAGSLKTYLTEMKEFAFEANDHTEFDSKDVVLELKKEMGVVALNRERIEGEKKTEQEAVSQILSDNFETRLARLKAIERKISTKHHEEEIAAQEEIDEKFRQREDDLVTLETELKVKLAELDSQEVREKLVRKVALSNSFRTLEDGIADQRNEAVEKLYTEVQLPEQAKEVLALLPDATQFRREVSPEKLFQVFNDRMKTKMLPASKAACNGCNSTNIGDHARGEMYCRDCGKYDCLDKELKQLVILPSIKDIATEQVTEQPKSVSPSESILAEPALAEAS